MQGFTVSTEKNKAKIKQLLYPFYLPTREKSKIKTVNVYLTLFNWNI